MSHTIDNRTPHPLGLYTPDTPDQVTDPAQGLVATYPIGGAMARCAETRSDDGTVTVRTPDGGTATVPAMRVGFGAVTGLPDPTPGTLFVVSRATAERVADREDVRYPDRAVRGPDGQIVGFRALATARTWARTIDECNLDPAAAGRAGEAYTDYSDGVAIAVGAVAPEDTAIGAGYVTVAMDGCQAQLEPPSAGMLRDAIAHAITRAQGTPSLPWAAPCPEGGCMERGGQVAEGSVMYSCILGHTWDITRVRDLDPTYPA